MTDCDVCEREIDYKNVDGKLVWLCNRCRTNASLYVTKERLKDLIQEVLKEMRVRQ